jgi:ribosomal subunit interface protein
MRTQITARRCELPDSVQTRAGELVDRLTRFEPRISSVDLVFEEHRKGRSVESVVKINGDNPVIARAEAPEFRDALDLLFDRLSKTLRRQRSQAVDRRGPSLSEVIPPPE